MVQNVVLGRRRACAPLAVTLSVLALSTSPGLAKTPDVAARETPLAIGGYCPVDLVTKKSWSEGTPETELAFDGLAYRFTTDEAREKFLADPIKFAPAFRGDCIVTWKQTGKRVAGKLEFPLFYEGRLFLFASADARATFKKQPGVHGTADLAYAGRSPVALVKDGKSVRGRESLALVRDGFRYHFSTKAEREAFEAAPTEFTVDRKKDEVDGGERTVTITGTSACAYCDFKVWPLLTEGELGLAIKAADGKIYVVEHADTKFTDLYNARFDGITLRVTGREIKRDGRFVWVVPQQLAEEKTPES